MKTDHCIQLIEELLSQIKNIGVLQSYCKMFDEPDYKEFRAWYENSSMIGKGLELELYYAWKAAKGVTE